MIAFPSHVVAASGMMTFWCLQSQCNIAIWITVFLLLPLGFNFFNVRRYGEIEFWLTTVKLGLIASIIVLGILLPMDASPTAMLLGTSNSGQIIECQPTEPNSVSESCLARPGFACNKFSTLKLRVDWREAPFKSFIASGGLGRLLGFWLVCWRAAMVYSGSEIIGLVADETENQRMVLPKVVRRVSHRSMFYYIGGVFVLGLNISSNDPVLRLIYTDPNYGIASAFLLMIQRAGIPELGYLGVTVAIIAAMSVANAELYVAVCCYQVS